MIITLLKNWILNPTKNYKNKKLIIQKALKSSYYWEEQSEFYLDRIMTNGHKDLTFPKIIETLFQEVALKHGKKLNRWGDQTVGNSKFILSMKSQFPKSKIIYMIRDPRAVVASYFDINKEYHKLNAVIARWEIAYEKYKLLKLYYPSDVIMIDYNSLVTNTSDVLLNVMNWLDEENSKINLNERFRMVKELTDNGKRHHAKLSSPIDGKSISKWKNTLHSYEIEEIENKLLKKYNELSVPNNS